MPPTAAPPAETGTASEPLAAAGPDQRPEDVTPAAEHGLEPSGESDLAVVTVPSTATPASGGRTRLPVLLLLLAGVVGVGGALTAYGVVDVPVVDAASSLTEPGSVLPVAVLVLAVVLLLALVVSRVRAAARSSRSSREPREPRGARRSRRAAGAARTEDARRADAAPVAVLVPDTDTHTAAGVGTEVQVDALAGGPAPDAAPATVSGPTDQTYDDQAAVAVPSTVSPQVLQLHVRCLEEALADQDAALADRDAALAAQHAVLEESRAAATRELSEVRDLERRRVRAVVGAVRDVVADLPGAIAADRVATALERLTLDPGFHRPLLAPASASTLLVPFAAPAPAHQLTPQATPEATPQATPQATPGPARAEVTADVEAVDGTGPLPAGVGVQAPEAQPPVATGAPGPVPGSDLASPAGPSPSATPVHDAATEEQPAGDAPPAAAAPHPEPAPAAPYKVMPVPAPPAPAAPARSRRGLLRGRS